MQGAALNIEAPALHNGFLTAPAKATYGALEVAALVDDALATNNDAFTNYFAGLSGQNGSARVSDSNATSTPPTLSRQAVRIEVMEVVTPFFEKVFEQLERLHLDLERGRGLQRIDPEHDRVVNAPHSAAAAASNAAPNAAKDKHASASDKIATITTPNATVCRIRLHSDVERSSVASSSGGPTGSSTEIQRIESLAETAKGCILAGQKVSWQWEHRTGFKDYDASISWRIEAAYQRGDNHTRLKTGKTGDVPMELFFQEMIQHDPVSGNCRRIRRVGPNGFWRRLRRWIIVRVRSIETGKPHSRLWELYEKQRHGATPTSSKGGTLRQIFAPTSSRGEHEKDNMFANIVQDRLFFVFSITAVALNCLWLCFQAITYDSRSATKDDFSNRMNIIAFAVDAVFCAIFTTEISLRFFAYEPKRKCIRDVWFIMDSMVVLVMLLEVTVMTLQMAFGLTEGDYGLSYLSMMRIIRLVRLVRSIPQLQLMIVSIWRSVPPIIITLLLLAMITFVFAVIFTTSAKEVVSIYGFGTLLDSLIELVVNGVFMDSPGITINSFLKEDMSFHASLFVFYILLCGYMVMNLLIGILCEIVQSANKTERNTRDEKFLRDNLVDILECYDRDDNGFLDYDEFNLALHNPDLRLILKKCSVDAKDLLSFGNILLTQGRNSGQPEQSRGMSTEFFLKLVLRLRGGNSATVADIVSFREYLDERLDHIRELITERPLQSKAQVAPAEGCASSDFRL